jgi:hypothetical protein
MPVNQVGDFGIAPGISGRFTFFQKVDFSTIFARASAPRSSNIHDIPVSINHPNSIQLYTIFK